MLDTEQLGCAVCQGTAHRRRSVRQFTNLCSDRPKDRRQSHTQAGAKGQRASRHYGGLNVVLRGVRTRSFVLNAGSC